MWKEGIVIRADVLLGFPELIDDLGGNSDVFLREAGIAPEDIKGGGNFISWLAFQRLLFNVSHQLNAPDLGLRWAKRHRPTLNNFGPIVTLLIISKDVRSFVERWIDYARIHTMGSYTQLVEGESHGLNKDSARAIVRFNYAARDSRQEKEAVIAAFYRLLRDHVGKPDIVATEIGFPHKPMASIEVYKEHFSCPIRFNADYAYIEFSAKVLDRKIGLGFNPGQKLFETHLERTLLKSPVGRASFSAQVGLILPQVLGLGKSDAAHVAATLGVSVRKMQRLLQDEGASYSQILDEVRESMALQLLQNSETSITRIANLLDYRSPTAFSNAFKRWRGISPRDYRRTIIERVSPENS